jgi:hypothetical protein
VSSAELEKYFETNLKRKLLGYVPQLLLLPNLTFLENMDRRPCRVPRFGALPRLLFSIFDSCDSSERCCYRIRSVLICRSGQSSAKKTASDSAGPSFLSSSSIIHISSAHPAAEKRPRQTNADDYAPDLTISRPKCNYTMKWPATVIKARANPWPCLEISGLFLFV